MATALLVKTSGEVETLTLTSEGSYRTISDAVGGYIDSVSDHERGIVAYVHDEGLLIGLEPNVIVSAMFSRLLVGDAVIVGSRSTNGYVDGENYDVPAMFLDEDFSDLAKALNTDERFISELVTVRDTTDWTPQVIGFDPSDYMV
jgi:hypothetical protein